MKKIFFMAAMIAATLSANASIKNTTCYTPDVNDDPTSDVPESIDIYPDDYANPEVGPCAKGFLWDLDDDDMD